MWDVKIGADIVFTNDIHRFTLTMWDVKCYSNIQRLRKNNVLP